MVLSQLEAGLQPELCLAIGVMDVHVHPGLFSREEEEPEATTAHHRWTHPRKPTPGI